MKTLDFYFTYLASLSLYGVGTEKVITVVGVNKQTGDVEICIFYHIYTPSSLLHNFMIITLFQKIANMEEVNTPILQSARLLLCKNHSSCFCRYTDCFTGTLSSFLNLIRV